MELSKKYGPLFSRPEGVDTYIVTGGRFSSKSYSVAAAAVTMADSLGHRILYGRYTNVSSKDSTFPEVEEKIEVLNCKKRFNINQNRIEHLTNKSKIIFKGFKTGSGTQTASLKSLKDFSVLIVEEAEEIPDYDTFEKVSLSIRGNKNEDKEPNIKILILNPTTKEHWIFKHFFEERGVSAGFNGVSGNVCYIHTNYLDCIKHVPEDSIRAFNDMKIRNPKRYSHIVLGGWLDKAEGVIFPNWSIGPFNEDLSYIYGMDFGYVNDPTTLFKVAQDQFTIWTKQILHKKGMSTDEIINFLDENIEKNDLIVADNAEPRLIEEIRQAGFNIIKCTKGKDSIKNGLAKMYVKEIISEENDFDMHKELNNYQWSDKKSNTPIDAWNHCIDGIRYAHEELIVGDTFYIS